QFFCWSIQGRLSIRKDRLVWMRQVKVLDRVTDGLDRPTEPAGDSPANGRYVSADPGEAAGAVEDLFPLVVREAAEIAAPRNDVPVLYEEPVQQRFGISNLPPAVDDYALPNQPA